MKDVEVSQKEQQRARASQRAQWPVAKYRLGEEPSDDLSATTTAEQRLQMMWPLAVEAWALSGRALPAYERHEMPVAKFLHQEQGGER